MRSFSSATTRAFSSVSSTPLAILSRKNSSPSLAAEFAFAAPVAAAPVSFFAFFFVFRRPDGCGVSPRTYVS